MSTIHNLGVSQKNYKNQTNFSTTRKISRHGKHKNPNYHKEYYCQNKEKLLAYGKIYYGVKKLLKPCLKKTEQKSSKNGVKKTFSLPQACDIYTNSLIDKKDYVGCWEKARDRQDVRLATKNKVPQYRKGSHWPTIKEMRGVRELITKYGEWGHRTGKKLGNYWDARVDFDFYHGGTSLKMGRHWEKSFKKLMNWLGIKYDKTQHGAQVNLLLKELPPNCLLYHIDRYGKKRIVGSILSAGRQAQGLGSPYKEPAGEGKWALKAQNLAEVAQLFSKFFFMIDCEAKMNKIQVGVKRNQVLNIKINEVEKSTELSKEASKKIIIQLAQILKRRLLPFKSKDGGNIYKFWYQQKGKSSRYFLLDTYQKHRKRVLDQLPVGSINNFILNQGQVYQFFYGFG
jgi:hypothetical protein